ncbi:MAG TPA: hypothetical protein VGM78_01055, partial [Ilumatobacteraceae bacterium]
VVNGNWIADGDSGAVVDSGASNTTLIDNHVERCRIGILVWDAPTTQVGPNTFVDLHRADQDGADAVLWGPDERDDLAQM